MGILFEGYIVSVKTETEKLELIARINTLESQTRETLDFLERVIVEVKEKE